MKVKEIGFKKDIIERGIMTIERASVLYHKLSPFLLYNRSTPDVEWIGPFEENRFAKRPTFIQFCQHYGLKLIVE